MSRSPRLQLLAFAGFFLVLLAVLVVRLRAPSPEPGDPDFVRMHIARVIETRPGTTYAVVLADDPEEARQGLLVYIGANEAQAIVRAQSGISTPRPLTHDLLERTIENLGARVVEVRITRIEGNTFIGELVLERGARRLVIDCRPSDAMALAVRDDAPIYVARPVLEQAGRSRSEDDESPLPRRIPADAI